MKIGVLGTGMVAQAIAGKLESLGHAVMVGTRDVAATLARSTPDGMGNPPFSAWAKQHAAVKLGTFAQAAQHGEMLVNATSGMASLAALQQAGAANLAGKTLIDIANPLDFSKGMPPTLSVCNTDSLGEQIQRAFPAAKVVKTLNTMNANLMVNPGLLAGGEHAVFVSGNDATARAQVTQLLQSFGWQSRSIIDLGDISSARGVEMVVPLWLSLMGALQIPLFSFNVVR
jgi:predicted dinucleotide-binding enzyme